MKTGHRCPDVGECGAFETRAPVVLRQASVGSPDRGYLRIPSVWMTERYRSRFCDFR